VAPREKIEVIYLGLELDRYQRINEQRGNLRRELSVSVDRPLIGCVGRLVPIKDLPTLFGAMTRLRFSVPNVILLVVGDGPERQKLELEVYRQGLGTNVRFLGFRRDLERIYADIDVAVNCSINEGTPVALIEAMSAGVPVVATNVGGTPDLLLNGLLGKLVSSGDPQGLSEAIHHTLTRRGEALQLACEARRQVLERFRSERLVSDLDRLYQRLLASKGVAREEML
jgi:glycosyltransferase involved in cell wall biosynthesis